MTNTPMTSNQQIKLIIFGFLLLPSLVFLVGIIPVLLLIFGIVMMKKNQDFSHIETSARIYKFYVYLFFIGFLIFGLYCGEAIKTSHEWEHMREKMYASFIMCGIAIFYIMIMNFLFLNPLRSHSTWIEKNGIFSAKAKDVPEPNAVDIIKGERLRTFSVADELTKWAKLKEDGHITDQEFNDARKKLLQ
ncbi:SHOCT domain-containing protein [Pseudomonas caricapapayae]|uniref:SHOCT domain-containing protein n=1 Tax=Pseudomonas caricapapayae TaxID=46678 RepID=UPI000F009CC3|nr:SHOCT domain-containing protein [Pseudomonas caricapapayae]